MVWDPNKTRERIHQFLETVPEFDGRLSLREHRRMQVEARKGGLLASASSRRAFLVTGAHLYGQILDFDRLVSENDQETERSHEFLLGTLHRHYQLWDNIVDDEDADRIDYHGGRMHGVVTEPGQSTRDQILSAIGLAYRLATVSNPSRPIRLRFGIDQGTCLAMTTGRALEKDVLFLGRPANYAAKLAAGDTEGIFLSPSAQQVVGPNYTVKDGLGWVQPSQQLLTEAVTRFPFERVTKFASSLVSNQSTGTKFSFYRPSPPLSDVKFDRLSPAKTARMGMAALFGDVHGFTKYVDAAIAAGGDAIKQAATRVHVIREELNAVLKDDFEGKRVRFIGDCIHGALAAGESSDDAQRAVLDAFLCASGMRSSFHLIQQQLGGMESLDLAVGVEYGPTPMTRLGLRGEDSVRCSTSRAVVRSEAAQQSLPAGGIKFGPIAMAIAASNLRDQLSRSSSIPLYENAVKSFGAPSRQKLLKPATAAVLPAGFPNRPTGPAQTDGFS
jgi:class 3 adenylate cyclase